MGSRIPGPWWSPIPRRAVLILFLFVTGAGLPIPTLGDSAPDRAVDLDPHQGADPSDLSCGLVDATGACVRTVDDVPPPTDELSARLCAWVGSTPMQRCELWSSFHDGPANYMDEAKYVVVSPDGSTVFVAGDVYTSGSHEFQDAKIDVEVLSYNATTGQRLWTASYTSVGGLWDSDMARGLAVAPDGQRVYVTASSWPAKTKADYVTFALDATTGQRIWLTTFDGPAHEKDHPVTVAASPDGSLVYVTGDVWMDDSLRSDLATIALNATKGNLVWSSFFGASSGGSAALDLPTRVIVNHDSTRVYVVANAQYAGPMDITTLGYDAKAGTLLWASTYSSAGDSADWPNDIAVSPDGARVFVTGGSRMSPGNADLVTLAYDSAKGATLWTRRFTDPEPGDDVGLAVAVDPDGSRIYVLGSYEKDGFNLDFATLAYEAATGTQQWLSIYSGLVDTPAVASNEWPRDLEVSSDGSALVLAGTGASEATKFDLVTLELDPATGAERWVKRLDGPRHHHDWAKSIALGPDGFRVFVAGVANGTPAFGCAACDFVTAAFPTA